MKPKIIEIGTPNLKDVPAELRRLADAIERGEEIACVHAIVVCESMEGEIDVYGYGEVGTVKSETGMLYMAALKVATINSGGGGDGAA